MLVGTRANFGQDFVDIWVRLESSIKTQFKETMLVGTRANFGHLEGSISWLLLRDGSGAVLWLG